MAAMIRPPQGSTAHAATEAIAKETDTDVEVVKEIYDEELTTLATDAKITQFLGVLTSRRVKMRLRKH
ncbi:DUF3562 domain-containing protein [Povalibacter sp.]|uniref:DUF3562 domain-containing protein n=1 Tax=Povalibacter sp. TaxID=1962978 RepID=UPI002F3FEF42